MALQIAQTLFLSNTCAVGIHNYAQLEASGRSGKPTLGLIVDSVSILLIQVDVILRLLLRSSEQVTTQPSYEKFVLDARRALWRLPDLAKFQKGELRQPYLV